MRWKHIIVITVVLITLCVILFFAAFQAAEKTAIDELNARQISQARQAKIGIEQYIHHYDVILELLSRNPDIAAMNGPGKKLLKLIFGQGGGDIRSMTRVDRHGRIMFIEPYQPGVTGRDISYQKHVRQILSTHEPAISDIFRTVQGYDAIVIHYPIFHNGTFDGSIAIVFSIEALADKFIRNIKIGDEGYAWMISREGIELSCPVPGHTGKPVSENAATSPSILAMAERMKRGEEGSTTYYYDYVRGSQRSTFKKLAVFMPIKVGNTFWSIVVATPEAEVLTHMRAFISRMLMIAALFAAGLIFSGYLLSRSWSEIKKRELQQKSEEKFRKTFDNAPIGMMISSLPDSCIIEVNDAYLARIGYARSEVMGRTVPELGLWTEPLELDRLIDNVRSAGPVRNSEVAQKSRDGSMRTMLVSADILSMADGNCLLTAYQDITEKRALEFEAVKANKLESIGVLAGGIAHDFNNLLTGILANISLIKLDMKEGSREYERLDAAEKASLRARDLTQQLLTFSTGGTPVRGVVSICRLVQETAAFSLHGTHARLAFFCEENLKPVLGDAGQISQVINNLVINAAQATVGRSSCTVTLNITNRTIMPDEEGVPLPTGDYVQIEVSDHGAGIMPEDLSRIFDPYYTTKRTGSGLGLAVVYSIIRNHDGHISVDSRPGEGTRFTILLHAADREPDIISTETADIVSGTGRILIVDDDESVRSTAGAILEAFGYQVSLAEDGMDALKQYAAALGQSHPFRGVIMDLTMPGGISGREATEQILNIDPHAVIIVSSGYSTDPIVADYRSFGFAGSVVKPYRADVLLAAIQECLAKRDKESAAGS